MSKNAQDIEALLCESSMKEVFRNVRIAEKIEDILWVNPATW